MTLILLSSLVPKTTNLINSSIQIILLREVIHWKNVHLYIHYPASESRNRRSRNSRMKGNERRVYICHWNIMYYIRLRFGSDVTCRLVTWRTDTRLIYSATSCITGIGPCANDKREKKDRSVSCVGFRGCSRRRVCDEDRSPDKFRLSFMIVLLQ